MALFDENGQEVAGAMTKEEAEAAAAKAITDAKAAEEAAAKEAADTKAAEDAAAAAAAAAAAGGAEDPAAQALSIAKRLEKDAIITRVAGQDAEKRTAFSLALDKLPESSYGADEAGQAARIADATKLAFGTEAETVIPDGTGGGRNVDTAPKTLDTATDKAIQKVLGISAEDVAKYGPEVTGEKK